MTAIRVPGTSGESAQIHTSADPERRPGAVRRPDDGTADHADDAVGVAIIGDDTGRQDPAAGRPDRDACDDDRGHHEPTVAAGRQGERDRAHGPGPERDRGHGRESDPERECGSQPERTDAGA